MFEAVLLATMIAIGLGLAWIASRVRSFIVLALLWASYAAYEYLMYARVLCSGECNIRVDLLLFYPALLVPTIWVSIAATLRHFRRKPSAESDA